MASLSQAFSGETSRRELIYYFQIIQYLFQQDLSRVLRCLIFQVILLIHRLFLENVIHSGLPGIYIYISFN